MGFLGKPDILIIKSDRVPVTRKCRDPVLVSQYSIRSGPPESGQDRTRTCAAVPWCRMSCILDSPAFMLLLKPGSLIETQKHRPLGGARWTHLHFQIDVLTAFPSLR
jgi:hypothetical protein